MWPLFILSCLTPLQIVITVPEFSMLQFCLILDNLSSNCIIIVLNYRAIDKSHRRKYIVMRLNIRKCTGLLKIASCYVRVNFRFNRMRLLQNNAVRLNWCVNSIGVQTSDSCLIDSAYLDSTIGWHLFNTLISATTFVHTFRP